MGVRRVAARCGHATRGPARTAPGRHSRATCLARRQPARPACRHRSLRRGHRRVRRCRRGRQVTVASARAAARSTRRSSGRSSTGNGRHRSNSRDASGSAASIELLAMRPWQRMWPALGEFFADPRLQQLFGRYATYCGSSPLSAPATLMLVAHVEQDGVWLVHGGMHELARALAGVAAKLGAELRYGAHVARNHRDARPRRRRGARRTASASRRMPSSSTATAGRWRPASSGRPSCEPCPA